MLTVEAILPTFLPREVSLDQVFEAHAVHKVIEGPPGGDVTHDQNPLSRPAKRQVREKATRTLYGLLPTLTIGIRSAEMLAASPVDLRSWRAVEVAEVALPKPPINQARECGTTEGDLDRLGRSAEVRYKNGDDVVMEATLTQFTS